MTKRIVLVGLALLFAATPAAAQQKKKDGLRLFTKMMPVFSHARCANCHGTVDPVSGKNHEGGAIPDVALDESGALKDNVQCLSCHTSDRMPAAQKSSRDEGDKIADAGRWRLPPRHMNFAGKNATQTCEQIKDWVEGAGKDPAFIISHLRGDPLIAWGFEGKSGGARDPDPVAPPPMSQDQFVSAFQTWFEQSDATCDPANEWTGTISIGYLHSYQKADTIVAPGVIQRITRVETTDTMWTTVVVEGTKSTAYVNGFRVHARTTKQQLNPSTCGFPFVEDITYTDHSGSGIVDVTIKEQMGTGKYILQFVGPPYTDKVDQFKKYSGMKCGRSERPASQNHESRKDAVAPTRPGYMIVTDKPQTMNVMVSGEKLEVVTLHGRRVSKHGDDALVYVWDLNRKPVPKK